MKKVGTQGLGRWTQVRPAGAQMFTALRALPIESDLRRQSLASLARLFGYRTRIRRGNALWRRPFRAGSEVKENIEEPSRMLLANSSKASALRLSRAGPQLFPPHLRRSF